MKSIKFTFIIFVLSFVYTQHTWSNTKEIAFDSLLDSLEIAKVDSIVSLIPPDSVSKFEQKYESWIESTNKPEFQAYSNQIRQLHIIVRIGWFCCIKKNCDKIRNYGKRRSPEVLGLRFCFAGLSFIPYPSQFLITSRSNPKYVLPYC
jgi:hypothetical protein